MMSPEGLFHAAAGFTGIIAGIVALISRKGGRTHIVVGRIFVTSIVAAALSAVWLAVKSKEFAFIGAGALVVYFMLTAWMTVRRRERESGWFEVGAFFDVPGLGSKHPSGRPSVHPPVQRGRNHADLAVLRCVLKPICASSKHCRNGARRRSAWAIEPSDLKTSRLSALPLN